MNGLDYYSNEEIKKLEMLVEAACGDYMCSKQGSKDFKEMLKTYLELYVELECRRMGKEILGL